MRLPNTQTGTKLLQELNGKPFSHDVRELMMGGDVQYANLAKRHLFPHKVDVHLNVLGAVMMKGIRRHEDNVVEGLMQVLQRNQQHSATT